MKRKLSDGWHVYSEDGKHFGGPYATEGQADKRLAQMEYFKHQKKKGRRSAIPAKKK